MNSFLRGLALGAGAFVVVALAYAALVLFGPVAPSCDVLRASAEAHVQAVATCANVPGCTFTADHIRAALESKAAAESCQ